MIGKKINQLATELAPTTTDLTIIGDPVTGVSKKITLEQLGAIFGGAVSFYTTLGDFPVTGVIDIIYCAKDTKKLYLWSGSAYVEVFPSQSLLDTYQLRSEKGVSNGYASLDVNGKVPIGQLPNSIMEYKGTWNAATNTPTLANGTGDTGDVYICNAAGTVNFGAGPITFAVGDYVVYSGTIWQRSSGAVGTVTSVAVSRSGDALTITGSPITTSGTINLGFAGNSTQYINGAGSLTTFPTLLSSVGLSMPSAFSVANSPLTANGTIAVTGAGNATQYVRGDGQLATLPTNGGGGGASVSYYLNGSINQGTIGGVTYYEMNKTPIIGAGTDFSRSTNGYIASFLTDANDPALLNIPAGNFNFETYFQASSGGGSPTFYIELYKYDGTTFTLIASNSATPKLINDGTNIEAYFSALAVPQTTLTLTDRLAVRIYVTTAGRTITLHTENGHLCQVITTFTTGLTALNGLTSQVQYLATGTSGTDFNISSVTATHTFNLPTASATNRGALSSADWTIFNSKQAALNGTGFVKISGTTISYDNSTYYLASNPNAYIPLTALSAGAGISYNNTTGVIASTITQYTDALARAAISLTTTGTSGAATYNNTTGVLNIPQYQTALTNPVTGTGTTNYLPKFTGTSTIGNSAITDDGTTVSLLSRALSGTSATFSSSVNIGTAGSEKLNIFGAGSQFINVKNTTTNADMFVGMSSVLASGFIGTGGTDNLVLSTGGVVRLTLNGSTGAATFSSSVTAGGTLTANTGTGATFRAIYDANNILEIGNYSATSGYQGLQIIGSPIKFYTGTAGSGSATLALTIATNQVATFSSNIIIDKGTGSGTILQGKGGSDNSVRASISFDTDYSTFSSGGNRLKLFDYSGTGITIDNGNVGIGTTNPSAQLQVSTTSTSQSAAYIEQNAAGDGLRVTSSGNDGTHFIANFRSTGVDRMRILDNGNVGIGTTSPNGKLNISNGGAEGIEFWVISATATNLMQSYNRATSAWNSLEYKALDHIFYGSGSERMRITSGGAVEMTGTIKTASPSSGSAHAWKLGSYAAGGTGTATGVIYIEVNGQIYSIPALLGTP